MGRSPGFDVIVIGGGIVGVAAARALADRRGCRVAVLEAEPDLARHQTGRNSGVIHSGLYYRPGSEKARLCSAGRDQMYRFCAERSIPHRRCGKLVLATREAELAALEQLQLQAAANGLEGVERLDRTTIRHHEPAAAGAGGLWVPQTGVVDFAAVTHALAYEIRRGGGEVLTDWRVRRIAADHDWIRIESDRQQARTRVLVNCAGLHSDRVARLAGLQPSVRLIPFRGEYLELTGTSRKLVRSLIYPVPDPRFPFLGVHLTRTVDDRVLAGPSAVPAFKRDGYLRSDFSLRDTLEMLGFPGSWRLASRFWRTACTETRLSFDRRAFHREVARLVPAVSRDDLRPAPSGVRAQAVDHHGRLLDDFFILQQDRMIHVLNAPSPAATAALAIGDHLADLASPLLS